MVGSSAPVVKAANEYFDTLVKSRFIEMFEQNTEQYSECAISEMLANVSGGGTPSKSHAEYYGGNIPWVTSKDVKQFYINDSEIHITEAGLNNSAAKMVPANSIILVVRSGILKHTLPVAVNLRPISINQDLKGLQPNSNVNSLFLAHAIKRKEHDIIGSSRATTVDNVEIKKILEMKIPNPPLNVQNQFADFVKQVDKSKLLFQQMVSKYDELVKSRFIEMFGKYFNSNEIVLADLCTSIDSGKSYTCGDPRTEVEPAILKLGAVFGGEYNPNENKVVDPDLFKEEFEVKPGDVLFSRKNTYELVGTAAYVWDTPPKLMLPDLIFRINLNDSVNPIYFVKLINHPLYRVRVTSLAHGAASSMPNISKKELLGLGVPLPPITEQNLFADFVRQVDKSKSEILEGIKRLKLQQIAEQ